MQMEEIVMEVLIAVENTLLTSNCLLRFNLIITVMDLHMDHWKVDSMEVIHTLEVLAPDLPNRLPTSTMYSNLQQQPLELLQQDQSLDKLPLELSMHSSVC
jgi:hypothetical protein